MHVRNTCPFCGGKLSYQAITTNHEVITEVEVECSKCGTEFKLHSDPIYTSESFSGGTNVFCAGKDALEKWNEVSALYEKSTEKSSD